ncbi:hypothetical protein [Natrarchaeobaculum sulfurireducens]|uniref:hypothetical protein n=1 Tax=Natrarchaeobaculum sulfurireducens TaxID=2044521 RepID=UPI00105AB0B7|nr:hypothetical protein [Natrarchaeobaculum sulfurireducens]
MTTSDTLQDARRELEAYIPAELAEKALNSVNKASRKLIDEYDLHVEVDPEVVAETLQQGFATIVCEWLEADTWQEDDVEDIIDELERNPKENLTFVAGFVAFENADMKQVSQAIHSATR